MSDITLGIIGSGQLGSLLCQAAKKLNVKTIVISDDEQGPAQNYSNEFIYSKYDDESKIKEFIDKVSSLPLLFEPGTKWHYSIAVDITGVIIERLSGKTFSEYLSDNIFAPLGMKDTFFEVPNNKLNRFLPNHYYNKKSHFISNTIRSQGKTTLQLFATIERNQ